MEQTKDSGKEETKEKLKKPIKDQSPRSIVSKWIDEDLSGEVKSKIESAFGKMTERDEDIVGIVCNILYRYFPKEEAVTKEEELTEEKMKSLAESWADYLKGKPERLDVMSAYYSALKYIKSHFTITKKHEKGL